MKIYVIVVYGVCWILLDCMGTVVNYGWVQWNEMADLICQLGGGGGEPVERMLDRYVLLHVMHLWIYG